MSDLEDWIKHGDEMRRPLLVNPALSKSEEVSLDPSDRTVTLFCVLKAC